jgi:glycosyltransferase involved in cell wall biosynthesis
MGTEPDVSVIVPVYNGAPYLERCYGSIAAQSLGSNRVQVIFIDDGSTDDSPAMLDRIASENPSVDVFHTANSGGPAAPRNVGIDHARGRFIFFLDQDDALTADALQAMVTCADANATDIVIARMRSLGGRTTPLQAFTRSIPRTDVFSSSVYWVLNPLKLFRTSMIRSLGLRFPEDVRLFEDQPFVAAAYLGCNGISILADRDYILWIFRDDATNITLSRVAIDELLPGIERMMDMLAAKVPPGPKRDALMRRHFEADLVGQTFPSYRGEPDAARRSAGFAVFRRLFHEYYTDGLDAAMVPRGRILARLVAAGEEAVFAEYLEALAHTPTPPDVLFEDEHVYVQLPHFRDPALPLADELFDAAPRLAITGRFEALGIAADGLRVQAACRYGALTVHTTEISFVARSRDGAEDLLFPLAFEVVRGQGNPTIHVDGTVPMEALLAMPTGVVHEVFLRICAGSVCRERKIVECAPAPAMRLARGAKLGGGPHYLVVGSNAKGHLTVSASTELGMLRRLAGRMRRGLMAKVRGATRA